MEIPKWNNCNIQYLSNAGKGVIKEAKFKVQGEKKTKIITEDRIIITKHFDLQNREKIKAESKRMTKIIYRNQTSY